MNLLYVDRDGLVRWGLLLEERADPDRAGPILFSKAGRQLAPRDILALLAPRQPGEDERAALHRAAQVGYRVEPC